MPRISKEKERAAKKFMATLLSTRKDEVVGKADSISSLKIAELLKKEADIVISLPTITKWMKMDLTQYNETKVYNNHNEVKEYDVLMKSAKKIWDDESLDSTDRSKAYNSYLRAKKQKEQLLEKLAEQQIKQSEAERPIYLLDFQPSSAKHICPKCGAEFYEIEGDNNDTETKEVN